MTPKQFVEKFRLYALATESKSGISATFILAQAALESGWGKKAPGYNFFGIKDRSGKDENRQLLTTTEFSTRDDLKFPEIISITPVMMNNRQMYRYRIRDYFRKYNSPEDSFDDHSQFFYKNPRYRVALGSAKDPVQFAIQVAKAGYATDPDYANTLIKVIRMIENQVK